MHVSLTLTQAWLLPSAILHRPYMCSLLNGHSSIRIRIGPVDRQGQRCMSTLLCGASITSPHTLLSSHHTPVRLLARPSTLEYSSVSTEVDGARCPRTTRIISRSPRLTRRTASWTSTPSRAPAPDRRGAGGRQVRFAVARPSRSLSTHSSPPTSPSLRDDLINNTIHKLS